MGLRSRIYGFVFRIKILGPRLLGEFRGFSV